MDTRTETIIATTSIFSCRLPPEIKSLIFEAAIDEYPEALLTLRSVCLTCRSWYQLAVHLPNLWRFVELEYPVSLDRLSLWLTRSRPKLIHIHHVVLSMAEIIRLGTLKSDAHALAGAILGEFDRWREVHIDAMKGDPAWIGLFADRTAHGLETMVWKWSGNVIQFPPTSSFPRLRTLVLERAACHWAGNILTNSPCLRSLTLARVEPPNSLDMLSLWDGLTISIGLEELQLDELTWSTATNHDTKIHLPKLRIISLTAVAHTVRFLHALFLPSLMELLIGDVVEDLGPAFLQLADQTSAIEAITTGLWEECPASASSSERGLISLIQAQPHIRSLSLEEATVTDAILIALTTPADDDVPDAQVLETLELPGKGFSPSALINMARSRHDHALAKTIEFLHLPTSQLNDHEVRALSRFVVEMEISVNTNDFEDT